ncbi:MULTISPECIES: hypothetical protein, partial [Pseudanabaena]
MKLRIFDAILVLLPYDCIIAIELMRELLDYCTKLILCLDFFIFWSSAKKGKGGRRKAPTTLS